MKEFRKWANSLSDEELKKEYYDAVDESLGSLVEAMWDLDYDISDIEEQANYEQICEEKADILELLCLERGIKLWNEE